MLLCEGSVYARMTSREGREFTLTPLTAPPTSWPRPFIFATENIYPVTILAQSDCRLWIIDRSHILKLLERDTAILRNFLRDLGPQPLPEPQASRICPPEPLLAGAGLPEGQPRDPQPPADGLILGVARPSLSRTLAQLLAQGRIRKTDTEYTLA